ncbi:MAG TPA: AAA family ATPase [Herpetosiphonaceae bacterium]|nr:AAA family ATPase [Herpetosiphonaceae bacterium]
MSGVFIGKARVLLIDEAQAHVARVRELLRGEDMELTVLSAGLDAAVKAAKGFTPDVILLALARGSLTTSVERLDAAYSSSPIVAILTPEQMTRTSEVLLAGARAYLPAELGRDDLVDTIMSVLERERRRRAAIAKRLGVAGADQGQIVAVHGVKGGVGATTIAINLAIATRLATRARVALVDANLYSGDVAVSLNLLARSSLADLTPHLKELDQEFLQRASVRHVSGLSAFLAPDDFERAQTVNGEQIGRILKVMRQHFDYIIVDTCSLPDQVTSAALDAADKIVCVLTPELPALKNAARFLQLAADFGYGGDKLIPTLNRANSPGAVGLNDITEHLRCAIAVAIPSEGRTLIRATNAGEAVVSKRRGRFAHGIWQLTALVTGAPIRQLKRAQIASTQAAGATSSNGQQPAKAAPRPRLFARLRPRPSS